MCLVVKAESEQGERLYIRKATLRQWRQDFAACLRAEGVAANATPRAARGGLRERKKDPIHQRLRALKQAQALRAEGREPPVPPPVACRYLRERVAAVAETLERGVAVDAVDARAKENLLAARRAIVADWTRVAEQLDAQGEGTLAREVRALVAAMPPIATEKERIAQAVLTEMSAARGAAPGSEASSGNAASPNR